MSIGLDRSRVAVAALAAAGAGLFGTAVGGMTQIDDRLAASAQPAPVTRFVADDDRSWADHRAVYCPDRDTEHPEV